MPQIPHWNDIVTPLQVEEWNTSLCSHPDRDFYSYIIGGISSGLRIDFIHQHQRKPAKSKILSAVQNPGIVGDYLKVELEEGGVLDPIAQVGVIALE